VVNREVAGDIATDCPVQASSGNYSDDSVGDLAADEKGADGITARDIMDFIPPALKNDRAGVIAPVYFAPAVI
jgi:hypothetical protein